MKTETTRTRVIDTERLRLRAVPGTNYDERRTFAIERKDTAAVIGSLHLSLRPDRVSAELGFEIVPAFRRRGHATEALRGLLRHAFRDLGLLYLNAGIPAGNPAAGRVVEKAGMKFENRIEGGYRHDGQAIDRLNHGLFADEWQALIL